VSEEQTTETQEDAELKGQGDTGEDKAQQSEDQQEPAGGSDEGAQAEDKDDEDMSASEKAQKEEEEREEAKEKVKKLEEEGAPDNLEDWPSDKAKYETFGGPEGEHSYHEGPEEEHLGPSSLRHHEDGETVTIAGKEVDDPDEYKSEPIPGGPTDENSNDPSAGGEGDDEDSDDDSDDESKDSEDKEEAEA
jgi:translation initiation factor 5B